VQAGWARAGVVFCKHNVVNEFDNRSDVAAMYRIRHVPSFLFFCNGALVGRSHVPDTRTSYRPSGQVRCLSRRPCACCAWTPAGFGGDAGFGGGAEL